MKRPRHVAIVGAGVAGLTAAYELTKAGCAVSVLEQRDEIGGLARSMALGGAPLERYFHFVCGGDEFLKQMADELGLAGRLHWVQADTSYYVAGRLHPFTTPLDILRFSPISLLSRLRFGLHGARARGFTDWKQIEHLTAQEWLIAAVGQQAYETIWKPLLHMKFGGELETVSAPWIWHRMHRVITSRESLLRPERFGYFEGGTLTLLSALAERISDAGGQLHLGRPVRSLLERDGRIAGIRTDEGDLEADVVISTAPLPALSPLLPESAEAYRQGLDAVSFLGVVCLLVRLRENVTSSFWVNVNDPRAPFQGFVEYSNLNPWREIGGSEVLYIPLYMPREDPRFTQPDADLAEELLEGLETLFPHFDRSQVVEWVVTRDLHAQALCPPHFSEHVPSIASPVPGLFITDSTQLYPADRNVSGMIGLARQAARMCLGAGQ